MTLSGLLHADAIDVIEIEDVLVAITQLSETRFSIF